MKHTLEDGGWVVIRDPRKLSERLAEKLEDAQFALMELPAAQQFQNEDSIEALQDAKPVDQIRLIGRDGFRVLRNLKRTSVLVYVESWSFGDSVNEETILELPAAIVTEIYNQIGIIVKATGGPGLNTDASPDPESPTARS